MPPRPLTGVPTAQGTLKPNAAMATETHVSETPLGTQMNGLEKTSGLGRVFPWSAHSALYLSSAAAMQPAPPTLPVPHLLRNGPRGQLSAGDTDT